MPKAVAKKPRVSPQAGKPQVARQKKTVPAAAMDLAQKNSQGSWWPVLIAAGMILLGAFLASVPDSLRLPLGRYGAFWSSPLTPGGWSLQKLFLLDASRMPGFYLEIMGMLLLAWAFWGRGRRSSLLEGTASLVEFTAAVLLLHFLAAYLVILSRRIGYPYELECMEGTQVDMVKRVLRGQSLYTEPSMEFVGVVYTPLYYYVGALVSKFAGVGLPQLRYVSLASVIGILGLLLVWLRRETGRLLPGFIAIGFFAACFALSGYWYDIARVDSLSVFCTLLGAWAVRFSEKKRDYALAGVIFFLAVMVKQSAAVVIPFMMVYLYLKDREGLKAFALTGAVLGVIAGVWLAIGSGGWSTYYLFTLPRKWVVPNPGGYTLWGHFKTDIWPACLIALAGLAVLWSSPQSRDKARFYSLLLAGAAYTVHTGLKIQGAWLNHLILLHAPLALLVGLAFHEASLLAWGAAARLALSALLFVQMGHCLYDPERAIPGEGDRMGWDKVISDIKAVKGDVLMPFHGYLPSLAGKKESTFVLYANAILMYMPPEDPVVKRLNADLEGHFRNKDYAAIVMDGYGWVNMTGTIEKYYDGVDYAGPRPPITGWQVSPNKWYTPKPDVPVKAAAH